VLEGLDGAGTTTQARILGERLRDAGRRVHVTAEPSSGPVGALVRQVLTRRIAGANGAAAFDPAALALLFAADRRDHVAVEIEPKLREGADVVCDRYALSSLAYQGVQLGGTRWVAEINREAPTPDLVVFLRCRPEVAMRRRRAASLDREIFEVDAFQRRVAAAYDGAIARLRRGGDPIVSIDGERPIDEVSAAVWAAVLRLA
jgi:dTMP kinase